MRIDYAAIMHRKGSMQLDKVGGINHFYVIAIKMLINAIYNVQYVKII